MQNKCIELSTKGMRLMTLKNKALFRILSIAIIITFICFYNVLNPYKNSTFVMSNISINNINSSIKSDLISIRNYCGISEQLLTDALSIIDSDPSTSKNRLYYAKYYYNLSFKKISETINNINSIPNLSSNKAMSQLLSSLQEKQLVLQTFCENIDELNLSIDRRVHPSQSLLNNLKYNSTTLLALLNILIES